MIFRASISILVLLLAHRCVAEESSVRVLSTSGASIVSSGQAVTIMNDSWRFHIGDDTLWADPGFDDSTWEAYKIAPDHAPSALSEVIEAAPLPGWQGHGHPGYVGYAWYRISIDTASDRNALAILIPRYVDDAYEIYVNGKQIGAFGQFGRRRTIYTEHPELFPIPSGTTPASGPFTIAIRFRCATSEGLRSVSKVHGGLRGVPLFGSAPLLAICYKAEIAQLTSEFWSRILRPLLWASVGLISLFLFAFTRTHSEYLWAGISLCGIAIGSASRHIGRFMPIPIGLMVPCWLIGVWIGLSAGPVFIMYLLGVHKLLWRRLNYIYIAVHGTGAAILIGLYLGWLPPTLFWDNASWIQIYAHGAGALLVLAIVVDGVRTIGSRAWVLLMPGLLGACGLLTEVVLPRFSTVSVTIETLVPVALLVVFLLRAAQQNRDNAQYLLDIRQAQEVQQLLLPEHLPQIAGSSIESVYLPAREVGGDFFQVLETTPGSVLIVFGDVAGKGLPAAMLVAMLVGAIRTRANESADPVDMLNSLNERLCENAHGGLATCVAVHISAEGSVDLANAGQLPPYLNGEEINLEGALPLGVAPGIEFATTRFWLKPGDRLAFVSDGVVEAQNSRKELFGFDRLREISTETAVRIADAARRFGQGDDITVLTFGRLFTPA